MSDEPINRLGRASARAGHVRKEERLSKLVLIATVLAFAGFAPAAARAVPPDHESFSFPVHFVDTGTCGFPVTGDFVDTNDVLTKFDAAGNVTGLQLHQTSIGTLTANGITLRENDHFTIFVTFVDGVATQSKHVGVLFHLTGPGGKVVDETGQEVFEVVNGVDGPLLKEVGAHIDFDPATLCAALTP